MSLSDLRPIYPINISDLKPTAPSTGLAALDRRTIGANDNRRLRP